MNGKVRNRPFAALVLAGDRSSSDPLVAASGRGCKALVEIDGTPMILRVLDALGHSAEVGEITICGPSRESIATEARLQQIMSDIHGRCVEAADEYGDPGNYVMGANVAAYTKVADAMVALGLI